LNRSDPRIPASEETPADLREEPVLTRCVPAADNPRAVDRGMGSGIAMHVPAILDPLEKRS